jgi:hypothetical protein
MDDGLDASMTYCSTCLKPERACVCTEETIIIEEISYQLRQMGARLCNYEFFSHHIGRLQVQFGAAVVTAALRQHHAALRRAVTWEIQQQRAYAKSLKRSSEGL